jgi:hypothetical protein
MKISRQNFICAVFSTILFMLIISRAEAGINNPGSALPINFNLSRTTVNVDPTISYANLARGMGFVVQPNNCSSPPCADSNGYPNQVPTSAITANPSLPSGYYGTFTWAWSGTGSMQDLGGPPELVISGGGVIFEMSGANSGDLAPGNHTLSCSSFPTCNGATNPSIVFSYGWNIQSISNNGSGLIRINTKTNFVNNSCWGTTGTATNGSVGPLINISGAASNTGANGTWAITNCGASSFDLVGSAFTNAQASAVGQAIFAANNLSYRISNSGTFSGFTNLVIAETPNLTVINAGHYWDPVYVTQLQTLMNPNATCVANHDCGWLRFMDFSGTQNNLEKDFSLRIPGTALGYGPSWFPSSYYVGAITNTGDALTASDPITSTWNGSSYIDGAYVQGTVSATNATVAPTLNVGGHGAKPILNYDAGDIPPIWIILNGIPTSPGTDTFTFTFSAGAASWFNGGSNCVVTYTTQVTDTSIGTLSGHLDTWFGGGSVGSNTPITCLSASSVQHGNAHGSIGPVLYPPTAQSGRLTAAYSSVADPTLVSIGTMTIPTLATSGIQTFIYNYLMDAWVYKSVQPAFSAPIEAAIDLANQVGANVYWNFGTNSSNYVQSVTTAFGNPSTGLANGLKFGFETGNEVWNCFGPFPCPFWKTLGTALGITPSSNASVFNYTGLRTAQYASVVQGAWTGQGRSASDLYVFIMAQADNENVNGNFDSGQLKGSSLNTTFVSNYGALGGGSTSINYTTVGNRPVDTNTNTCIGIAPYWGSPWWGNVGTAIVGTVANNAPWLQAQLDYANGLTSAAYTEISNTFNGITARTDGLIAGQLMLNAGNGSQDISTMFSSMEAIAASYDTYRTGAGLKKIARCDYEGAPQWAFGNNPVNGTNSASDATALSTLTTQIGTTLGWNVSAYTFDGANSASELAQQILTFSQAWKNSSSYANLIDSYYYQALKNTSGANREIHPAQFGYNANIWGLFPGDYHVNNQYQNFNAINTWNAGN